MHSRLVGPTQFTSENEVPIVSTSRQSVCEILLFLLPTRCKFSPSALREMIHVRSSVFLSFLNQSLLNEGIEIGVESTVIHVAFVVLVEFLLDSEPCGSFSPAITVSESR